MASPEGGRPEGGIPAVALDEMDRIILSTSAKARTLNKNIKQGLTNLHAHNKESSEEERAYHFSLSPEAYAKNVDMVKAATTHVSKWKGVGVTSTEKESDLLAMIANMAMEMVMMLGVDLGDGGEFVRTHGLLAKWLERSNVR